MLSQHTAVLPSLSTHFPAVSNPPPALGRVCRTKSFLCGNTTNPLLILPNENSKTLTLPASVSGKGEGWGLGSGYETHVFSQPPDSPSRDFPLPFFGKCCCFPLHTYTGGHNCIKQTGKICSNMTAQKLPSIAYIFSRNRFSRKKWGKSNMSRAKVKLQYTSKGEGERRRWQLRLRGVGGPFIGVDRTERRKKFPLHEMEKRGNFPPLFRLFPSSAQLSRGCLNL